MELVTKPTRQQLVEARDLAIAKYKKVSIGSTVSWSQALREFLRATKDLEDFDLNAGQVTHGYGRADWSTASRAIQERAGVALSTRREAAIALSDAMVKFIDNPCLLHLLELELVNRVSKEADQAALKIVEDMRNLLCSSEEIPKDNVEN